MRPNGLNGVNGMTAEQLLRAAQPAPPRQPRDIEILNAFLMNRATLKSQIATAEEALAFTTSEEEKRVLAEYAAWIRAKLEENGPVFAKAVARAVPLLREGIGQGLVNMARAVE